MTTSANKTAKKANANSKTNHDTGTKPKVMNYRTAMKLLRQVVKERENHKAPCVYFDYLPTHKNIQNKPYPICIVAEVVTAYDPTILDKLQQLIIRQKKGILPFGFIHENIFKNQGIILSPNAAIVLKEAQETQDNKNTWGEAVKEAEKVFNQIKAKHEQP